MADKWSRFGAPKIAAVEVDGPGQVKIGKEAIFDVFVTFKASLTRRRYCQSQVPGLRCQGRSGHFGCSYCVADGQYQVTLSRT